MLGAKTRLESRIKKFKLTPVVIYRLRWLNKEKVKIKLRTLHRKLPEPMQVHS